MSIYVGIDIGTTKVCTVVAREEPDGRMRILGVGIEPPGAAWGAMVSDGYKYLYSDPMLSFVPGIAIMLTVFSFNMVGDGLRDALDPRLRGAL